MDGPWLISSCLVGVCATWRGGHNYGQPFEELVKAGRAIPVCPEQLGGLPTPRPPAEIVGGTGADVLDGTARVITCDGQDVTEAYLRGASEVLRLAQITGARRVILKEKSPSCGSRWIYDGSFCATIRPGEGVSTALLRRNGIEVISDEEYLEQLKPRL